MCVRSSTSDLCTRSNDHIISDQLTTTTTTQDDHQLSTPHHTVDLNASVSVSYTHLTLPTNREV